MSSDISQEQPSEGQWACASCDYVYDPEQGFYDAEQGRELPPGTSFEELPDDVICPTCGASKANFRPLGAGEQGPAPAGPMGG